MKRQYCRYNASIGFNNPQLFVSTNLTVSITIGAAFSDPNAFVILELFRISRKRDGWIQFSVDFTENLATAVFELNEEDGPLNLFEGFVCQIPT